jgi:hypothetical protein
MAWVLEPPEYLYLDMHGLAFGFLLDIVVTLPLPEPADPPGRGPDPPRRSHGIRHPTAYVLSRPHAQFQRRHLLLREGQPVMFGQFQ